MVELSVRNRLFQEVEQAVKAHQPEMEAKLEGGVVTVEGKFVVSSADGPFDAYRVRIVIAADFPHTEPLVVEIGGRIPKVADRHAGSGACCVGIWEEWLLTEPNATFENFLTGWLHDYFVSQTCFETTGKWPFGERSHAKAGVLESFADVLGVSRDEKIVVDHLRLLSMSEVKGHHMCPCGSGNKLRQCHRDELNERRMRIQPNMARRMLRRLVGMK